jgi:hypothetical protein
VHLIVLQPRPTFRQVALWYLPLFLTALMPAVSVALGSMAGPVSGTGDLVLAAVIASGLLSLMLLLICLAANTGIAERLACGILMLAMSLVLGISAATLPQNRSMLQILQPAFLTGGVVGATVLLQLLHPLRWKLWAVALAGMGLLISATFLHQLKFLSF